MPKPLKFQPSLAPEIEPPLDLGVYKDLFRIYRWLIVSVTAAFFVVSLVMMALIPNYYVLEVQILAERSRDSQRLYEQMVLPNYGGEDDYFGTQIAILTGRKIVAQIEQEFGVKEKQLKIKAKRLPMSRVISLKVTHRDPVVGAKIANRLAELYVKEKTQEDLFFSQQMLRLLPGRADQALASSADAENIKEESVDFLKSVANDATIQKLAESKLEIDAQLQEASMRYKAKHPVMKELTERLNYVDSQTEERKKKILDNLKVSLTGQFQVSNTRVLMPATAPERPAGPPRVLGVLISTLLGFLLSVYAAILMEFSNQKIRDEGDLRMASHSGFLGSIPVITDLKRDKKDPDTNAGGAETAFVSVLKTDIILADAVARIRTRILYSVPYENARNLMITSSIPNEGKSTASALLGLSFSMLGRQIVLIDADLRRPLLHTYVEIPNEKGLSDYLLEQATVDEILHAVPGTTLRVITAGSRVEHPAELLGSPRFKQLLDELAKRAERVLVDAPPAMYLPDAYVISKYVPTAVLVCGSRVAYKKHVEMVAAKFEDMDHPFAGVIITRVNYENTLSHYHSFRAHQGYYYDRQGQKQH